LPTTIEPSAPEFLGDLSYRPLDCLADNVDTDLLVVVGRVEAGGVYQ
jgi:hypothetical protein